MASETVERLLEQAQSAFSDFASNQSGFRGTYDLFLRLFWPLLGGVVFWYFFLAGENDKPIRYTVPPPKYPEKKEILKNASIKVNSNLSPSPSFPFASNADVNAQRIQERAANVILTTQEPGSTAIRCFAPATGELLGQINPSTPAAIDRAIDAAAAAQEKWAATTTFRDRRAVLRTLLQHVLDNQAEIVRVACLDSGKTMVDAQLGEILTTVEKLQWTIAHGEKVLRPSRRPTNLLMAYKRNSVRYEPLGVVAALVSWNYPFHNMLGPIISSIFAGNGVVVKVSEQTAWSAGFFTSIARGALVAHGHDPALVQTVVCWPQTAGHLTAHPGISHITFIGSRTVCHKVAASAAKSLTPVLAELGGKDAAIVLDSALPDLPRVVETLLRGTFQASGQNCVGIERIVATPAVYDRLVALLEPRVRALRLGPDADVGAMISDASFARLEGFVGDAFLRGARVLVGGRRLSHPDHPGGFYFSPTLVADVTPEMELAREECFGPLMVLMRAASGSAADVLAVANAPAYGLGGSVFGREGDPALRAVVAGLRVGMVAVNDFGAYYAVQLPFGGVGGSGYGRFAGEEGLRGLCSLKAVCEDRWGWLGVRTSIPPPLRYPIQSQQRSWQFARGIIETGYGLTLGRKAAGVGQILKNS